MLAQTLHRQSAGTLTMLAAEFGVERTGDRAAFIYRLAAAMAAPAAQTEPCRRCSGTGLVSFTRNAYKNVVGLCFDCDGEKVRPIGTAEADAAVRKAEARRHRLLGQLRSALSLDDPRRVKVNWALPTLMEREPGRYAKMLDSIEAGRVEAVADALASYGG